MSKLCSFFHAFGTLPIRWRIVSFFFGMFYEFLSLVLVGFAFCFIVMMFPFHLISIDSEGERKKTD